MKVLLIAISIFVAYVWALPTVNVGDFINTPVWYPGDLTTMVNAQWAGGAGILVNDSVPNLVIKHNDGTYSTIVAPFECFRTSEDDPFYRTEYYTKTNGKIFLCEKTVFELNNQNIVNIVHNTTFEAVTSAIMADGSIVYYAQTGYQASTTLQTWIKNNGEWSMQHELSGFYNTETHISETVIANYKNRLLYVYDRQNDNSWLPRRTYTCDLEHFSSILTILYLDDTIISGYQGIFTKPFRFPEEARASNLPVTVQQYNADSDAYAVTATFDSKSFGTDLKPVGDVGFSMLAINKDVVIVMAPSDNYNYTRILMNGAAFAMRRQQDNSWKFETKFVQASGSDSKLNNVAGYENGRLYFVACRTTFVNGDRVRARKECGFKYAEWSP